MAIQILIPEKYLVIALSENHYDWQVTIPEIETWMAQHQITYKLVVDQNYCFSLAFTNEEDAALFRLSML